MSLIEKGLTFKNLIEMVVDDWKEQTQEMTDKYLLDDRSEWMKKYGIPHGEYSEESILWSDIHTIAIELEQLRRYGEIIYGDPKSRRKERITEE